MSKRNRPIGLMSYQDIPEKDCLPRCEDTEEVVTCSNCGCEMNHEGDFCSDYCACEFHNIPKKKRHTVTIYMNGVKEWDRAYLTSDVTIAAAKAIIDVCSDMGIHPASDIGKACIGKMKVCIDCKCSCPSIVEEVD